MLGDYLACLFDRCSQAWGRSPEECMEERKSMGGAIVDVFDAGVTLVKSEINALVSKVSDIAKAKGIGVVLLLAATGPLILALIFLILAVFYGLMRLGLGAWAAALLIALFSFVVTGAMIMLGIRKLGAEVETDEPPVRRSGPMTEDERLEAQYQAEQKPERRPEQAQGAGTAKVAERPVPSPRRAAPGPRQRPIRTPRMSGRADPQRGPKPRRAGAIPRAGLGGCRATRTSTLPERTAWSARAPGRPRCASRAAPPPCRCTRANPTARPACTAAR